MSEAWDLFRNACPHFRIEVFSENTHRLMCDHPKAPYLECTRFYCRRSREYFDERDKSTRLTEEEKRFVIRCLVKVEDVSLSMNDEKLKRIILKKLKEVENL